MAESFGLDRRIANYQGVRPIGLWRWDIECLVDVINSVLDDPEYYPTQDTWRSKRCATDYRPK